MTIYRMSGNGGGPQVLGAEELAVLSISTLAAYVDFNDSDTITLDSNARVSAIVNKASGASFTPGLAVSTGTALQLTTIGSDGQQGVICTGNRGCMISPDNIFPASGGFTLMSITQQGLGTDGFPISSGEAQNAAAGGPFLSGWFSTLNQWSAYTDYFSTSRRIPAGFVNDGGVCCSITGYDATSGSLSFWQDGVLRQTISGVGAPSRADRRAVLNGYRSGASYSGFLEGSGNLYIIVNEYCAPGSDELSALMALANARFPSEGWASL